MLDVSGNCQTFERTPFSVRGWIAMCTSFQHFKLDGRCSTGLSILLRILEFISRTRAASATPHGPYATPASSQRAFPGSEELEIAVTQCGIWLDIKHGPSAFRLDIKLHPYMEQKCPLGLAVQRFLFVRPKNHDRASRNWRTRDHPVADSTWSPESCYLIEKWLHNCSATHKQCKNAEQGWQPSRLLQNSEMRRSVRLVETALETTKGNYMSLSHR